MHHQFSYYSPVNNRQFTVNSSCLDDVMLFIVYENAVVKFGQLPGKDITDQSKLHEIMS